MHESLEDFVATPEGLPSRVVSTVSKADRLLIVDVSNFAYRGGFSHTLNTSAGKFSGHVFGAFKILMSVMEKLPAQNWYPVFCYDGINSKATRQRIDPNYKDNRDPTRFDPKPDVYDAFNRIPGFHIYNPDLEADDAVAWVGRGLKQDQVIVSSDKDFWALISDRVKVWSLHKDGFVEPSDLMKKFGVYSPDKVALSKALFGDSSDGIKGVHRLMKAQVKEALNAASDVDNFVELVMASAATALTKTKVFEGRAQIKKNLELIKPLPGIKKEHLRIQGQDAAELKNILTSWECFSIIDKSDMLLGKPWFADE